MAILAHLERRLKLFILPSQHIQLAELDRVAKTAKQRRKKSNLFPA
jgi:hypothetical protein